MMNALQVVSVLLGAALCFTASDDPFLFGVGLGLSIASLGFWVCRILGED